MANSSPEKILPRRLRALAILRFGSVDALHKRLPLCPRAIAHQISRNALSERMRQALIEQLGLDGWRFVLGEVQTLDDSPAAEVKS